jgi:hypothetical protein
MLTLASGFWQQLIDKDYILGFVAMIFGTIVIVTGIVFSSLKAVLVSRAREKTKRELAAYIAEGSLDSDKAVALAKAGDEVEKA